MMLSKVNLRYYLLCLYTIVIIFSDNTFFMYAATLLFGAYSLISCIKRLRHVKIDWFVIQHFAFISFCFMCSLAGFSRLPGVSMNRCLIMTINIIIGICVLSIVRDRDYYEKYITFFIRIVLVFEVYIFALTNVRLFDGRLGESMYSPLAYGGQYNSNLIGLTFVFALLFLVFRYCKKRRPHELFLMLFLIIGIVLSGSRKGIVSAVVCLTIVPVIYIYKTNKHSLIKLMRFFVVAGVVGTIFGVMLFKISILYDIVGNRIEAFVLNLKNAEEYADKSLYYRASFVDMAKQFFHESPIVGIGIDNFKYFNSLKGFYAHNNYWEILAGAGVGGFVLYYSTYLVYALKAKKSFRLKEIEWIPAVVFFILLLLIDYQMVTYLQRIIILMLFVNYASFSHKMYSDESSCEMQYE